MFCFELVLQSALFLITLKLSQLLGILLWLAGYAILPSRDRETAESSLLLYIDAFPKAHTLMKTIGLSVRKYVLARIGPLKKNILPKQTIWNLSYSSWILGSYFTNYIGENVILEHLGEIFSPCFMSSQTHLFAKTRKQVNWAKSFIWNLQ